MKSGVAAIAILAALTSCSRSTDLYDQDAIDERNRQEQERQDQQTVLNVNAQYAAAFEKAFGKVGPNVDWGFSRKSSNARAFTRAVGDYAQYKGSIQPSIRFPEDCDASNFLKDVPEGVVKLPTWGAGAGSYYIDAETQSVSTWAGASKIYVTGTVDLSEGDTDAAAPRFAPSISSEIYLLEGATLKLGKVSAQLLVVDAIYIAQGATLATDYPLLLNTATKVYNHGAIRSELLEVNTASFLYNVGILDTEQVNVESNESRLVNDGTINSDEVTVNAGALQNNAEWNVSGTTYINSNNSGWVNNGHWTTHDYTYIAGSRNVINNCFLEVKNDFLMNISSEKGAFKIDSGGGVLTKNFYGGRSETGAVAGPYVIVMGSEAVFVVEETAILESSRGAEEGFGIFGPTSGEYAVFQAKNIVRDPVLESQNNHGAVTYSGNLYVSAETHFAQGYDSDGSGTYVPQPFIYEKDGFSIADNIFAAGFKSGKPNINIPQTPCSPGFQGGDPLFRVIAEDLSASEAGDFDFNDVVFDVVKAENGKTTLKLICAGGVLPLRVRGANEAEGVEVHSLFGESTPNEKGQYKMYNTGAGPTVDPVTFEVEGTYTTPEQIRNIIIEVKKNDVWMELTATTGKAACKILVDDAFVPVTERRNIADENENFTNYVRGEFVNDFWWK